MTQPDVDPAPRSDVLCAPWASPADIPERHRPLLSDPEWEPVLMLASEILWMLSGRRWYGGGCTETVVLTSQPPAPGTESWPYDASWGNCRCWRWTRDSFHLPRHFRHYSARSVRLPRSSITAVTSVTVDGEPFADWRVIRAGWLERMDGGTWSLCDGSTEITYEYGEPPPEGGVMAAVELAIQIALDRTGDDECQLPQRVTSVTRQGLSMAVLDPQDFLENGRTGIYMVDLWLRSVNPLGRGQRGRVWSPDLPTSARI